jgi:hypothetical protein
MAGGAIVVGAAPAGRTRTGWSWRSWTADADGELTVSDRGIPYATLLDTLGP